MAYCFISKSQLQFSSSLLTDFVVSDFLLQILLVSQIFHSDFRFLFRLVHSDFCLDFFGVSDFSLRFFKSFRFFSFQISDELQILEMAQIFSHSDFRRFRFSPDF